MQKMHVETGRVNAPLSFIFELILTTFKLSIIFRGNWGTSVNCLELKIEAL